MAVLQEEANTDREQVFAKIALEDLAAACYRVHDDGALAQRIFDNLLSVLGDGYRARYHNLVANLHAHRGDHAVAVEHYRQAVELAPGEAAYHRYLSDSLRSLSRFDEARSEIERAFALDGDDTQRRDRLGTLANTEGNLAFERRDYRAAIECYARAIEQEPRVAVYYSNTAQAYESLNEPGRRTEHLAAAQEWFEKARAITRDELYTNRIARIDRRRQRVAAYGEGALDLNNVITPIAVEVAMNLVPLVSGPTATGLSVTLETEIAAFRDSLLAGLGVTAPGVRFRSSEDLPSDNYIIFLDEVPIVLGTASPQRRFFAGSLDVLKSLGASGDSGSDPLTGAPGVWVAHEDWPKLDGEAASGRASGPPAWELWSVTR